MSNKDFIASLLEQMKGIDLSGTADDVSKVSEETKQAAEEAKKQQTEKDEQKKKRNRLFPALDDRAPTLEEILLISAIINKLEKMKAEGKLNFSLSTFKEMMEEYAEIAKENPDLCFVPLKNMVVVAESFDGQPLLIYQGRTKKGENFDVNVIRGETTDLLYRAIEELANKANKNIKPSGDYER